MPSTTIKVTGQLRRGAALVEGTAMQLGRQHDNSLASTTDVPIAGDEINVTLNLVGQAGTAFTVHVGHGSGSVERKGRLIKDVAIRIYEIPLTDFS